MNPNIPEALIPYLGKPFRLPQGTDLETLQFIQFSTLSEEDRSDLFEYFLDDPVDQLVEEGKMVPIGVLGLTDNPDSYAEMGHGGLLLWDLRPESQKTEIYYYNNNTEEFSLRAPDLPHLDCKPLEAEPEEEDDRSRLEKPEFAPDWNRIGHLYREGQLAEALELLEALADKLITSNTEVTKMKVVLLLELNRTEEGLALAEDLVIENLGDGESQEFCGRMKLKAQAYDQALTQGESLLTWLGDDDNNKLRAAALALRGLARYHLGEKDAGLGDLAQAKNLYTLVIMKYPEIRTLLA